MQGSRPYGHTAGAHRNTHSLHTLARACTRARGVCIVRPLARRSPVAAFLHAPRQPRTGVGATAPPRPNCAARAHHPSTLHRRCRCCRYWSEIPRIRLRVCGGCTAPDIPSHRARAAARPLLPPPPPNTRPPRTAPSFLCAARASPPRAACPPAAAAAATAAAISRRSSSARCPRNSSR